MNQIKFSPQTLEKLNHILLDVPYKYAFPIVNLINQEIQKNFNEQIDNKEED